MENKQENSDMQSTEEIQEDEIFDDSLFEESMKQANHKKNGNKIHIIFFAIVLLLFLFAIIRFLIWNKGTESGYNPDEDTSEFDTEPLDYIQPLNSSQLEGKPDDGVTTIFCLGNSPFSDNGRDNYLAKELGEKYDATVVNASFPGSLQTQFNPSYSDEEPRDGISLLSVTSALVTGDFSTVDKAAAAVSEEASAQAEYLKTVDLSKADMLVIMYDLNDYTELRPVYDPGNTGNPVTFAGALESSIQLIQNKYPYIRIVVLSIPASGKTIDDYYVDGDIHDLGNGTLTDYLGHEANICMSNGVSFIDTYFGVINVDNRDRYLTDDYHLNEAGAQAIADRVYKLIGLTE